MKKILVILSMAVAVLLALFTVSCVETPEGQEQSNAKISLSTSSIEMSVGGEVLLTANAENVKSEIVWTSSDSGVVTVDGGKMIAQKKGTATVTASADGVSASCSVNVFEALPIIEADYENIIVGVGSTFTMSVNLINSDASPEKFVWSGEEGAEQIVSATPTADGASVTFEGVKTGETQYTVSCEIYGITVYKRIIVKAVDTSKTWTATGQGIKPSENDSCDAVIDLFKNITPDITLYDNDVKVENVSFVWSSDDTSIASVDDDGVITGNKEGSATVKCILNGTVEIKFNVTVQRPTYVLDTQYDLETYLAMLTLSDSLEGNINGATLDGVDIFFGAEGNTVAFDKAKLPVTVEAMGEGRELVIETDRAKYAYRVNVYSKVITTADEFIKMQDYLYKTAGEGGYEYQYVGYIVLGNDIDLKDHTNLVLFDTKAISGLKGNESFGFNGIFDGQGYSIKNYTVNISQNGLFAFVGSKGIIKNVAITDLVATSGAGTRILSTEFFGLLKDVYISVKTWENGKLLQSWHDRQRLENVVVEYTGDPISNDEVRNFGHGGHYKENIVNVYIIADIVNINTGCKTAVECGCGFHKYKSIDEMMLAANDYSDFSEDVWDTSSGIPVFKFNH